MAAGPYPVASSGSGVAHIQPCGAPVGLAMVGGSPQLQQYDSTVQAKIWGSINASVLSC